jgi:signal transduction histidine kinase
MFSASKNSMNSHKYKLIYSLLMVLLVCFTGKISAADIASETVELKSVNDLFLIGKQALFFIDESRNLTIQDIIKLDSEKQFSKSEKDVFTRPAMNSAVWFKITTSNLTSEDSWLEVGSLLAAYIDFYFPDENGNYNNPYELGSFRSENKKLYDTNLFWFPLTKSGNTKSKTFFIRILEESPFEVPLSIGTLRSLSKNKTTFDFLTASFMGLMVGMFIYNLFLYYSIKDSIYLYYLAYIVSTFFVNSFLNNFPVIEYLTKEILLGEWWHRNFYIWHHCLNLSIGFFSIIYLQLDTKLPSFSFLIRVQLFLLCFILPTLVILGVDKMALMNIYQPSLLIFLLTILFSSYYLAFKADRQAKFFVVGWTFFIISIIILVSVLNGLLPFNAYSRNAAYFGISIEVMLFSFALADRLHIMRKEKEQNQLKLVELTNEQNQKLEMEVYQRTVDLSRSNEMLTMTNQVALIGGWQVNLIDGSVSWSDITRQIHEVSDDFIPDPINVLLFFKDAESKEKLLQAGEKSAKYGTEFDLELQIITGLGNEIWIKIIGRSEFYQGTCIRQYGTFQNIDKQKKVEIDLLNSKILAESANKSKSEFLANISHEIRTPLNGIIGFTDLMMTTKLDESQEDYMNTVDSCAKALLDLVTNVLDFSKIEAGKLKLNIEKVILKDLLSQSIELVKFQKKDKPVKLILQMENNLPHFLWIDLIRVRQVLLNLLSNAVKFTQEGEIILSVEFLQFDAATEISKLIFSVKDTGIGISKENQNKIFDAFSQEDASITRKYGGTGLGLSISKNLLRLMESELELESELGLGSKFFFTLNVKTEVT